MEIKDYITITISSVALIFSFLSLLVSYLNFRRNVTKLKCEQLFLMPSPVGADAILNVLYLDRKQDSKLWTVVPMLYLVIYLKINNLSHTAITISNMIVNDSFLVSALNVEDMKEDLSVCYFASEDSENRQMERYGCATPAIATELMKDKYNWIKIGDRIESKSSIEGVVIIKGNNDLYNVVNDGDNKLTIVTPDKKFDIQVIIEKTIIPQF